MDQERIGKFIKNIRIKNNLTQKEFAEKLGVTYQAVSKWENGKNIPDIAIIKEISNIFNVDIDEIISGEIKNKSNKKNKSLIIIIISILLILSSILLFVNITHDKNFEFKTITTTCKEFKITGSAAYNKNKTSIYISNINYCGKEDNTIYKTIECNLYETYNNTETKISSCKNDDENITLEEYLKNVKINVDDYSQICKEISSSKLYLEINATDKHNKIITYKVSITFEDNCSK